MKDSRYFKEAELMLRAVPHVAAEDCFALKVSLWELSDLLLKQDKSRDAEAFIRELHSVDMDDLYKSSVLLRKLSQNG